MKSNLISVSYPQKNVFGGVEPCSRDAGGVRGCPLAHDPACEARDGALNRLSVWVALTPRNGVSHHKIYRTLGWAADLRCNTNITHSDKNNGPSVNKHLLLFDWWSNSFSQTLGDLSNDLIPETCLYCCLECTPPLQSVLGTVCRIYCAVPCYLWPKETGRDLFESWHWKLIQLSLMLTLNTTIGS